MRYAIANRRRRVFTRMPQLHILLVSVWRVSVSSSSTDTQTHINLELCNVNANAFDDAAHTAKNSRTDPITRPVHTIGISPLGRTAVRSIRIFNEISNIQM